MNVLDLDALEKLAEAARDVCAESWGEVRGGHATGDLIWRLAEALPALIKRVRELEGRDASLRQLLNEESELGGRQLARIRELEEALRPFAAVWSEHLRIRHNSDVEDFDATDGLCVQMYRPDWTFENSPTLGDSFRHASVLLNKEGGKE